MTPDDRRDAVGPVGNAGCLDSELLASYVDGRCTEAEVAEVERHLAWCEECYAVFMASARVRHPGIVGGRDAGKGRGWKGRWFTIALAAAAVAVLAVSLVRRGGADPGRDLQAALIDLDRVD